MRRYIPIFPLLLITAIVVAACGSSSSGDPTSSAARTSSDVAFAQCMRSHGVPSFPDSPSNGHGVVISASQRAGSGSSMTVNGVSVSAPAFRSAMRTCRKYLPGGGTPTAAQSARARAQALAMSRCMRSHGVPDFPDPHFGTGPGGGPGIRLDGAGLDPNSPAFQHAMKVCAPLFAKGVPVGGQSGGQSGG